nr:uncharacterized protein LOC131787797 [Pocillopora verrucosa]
MAAGFWNLLCLIGVYNQLIPRSQPPITKLQSNKNFYYLLSINGESIALGTRNFPPFPGLLFRPSLKRIESTVNAINYSISKISKHGSTVLILPGRLFWLDLTIYMDIQCNPGPESGDLTTQRPGERGVNLQNLCSIKRVKENKQPSKAPGGLEILHLNIRSLKNRAHLLELRQLASERKSDIITISETWLNTTVTSEEIQIEGYKLHRLDRLHKGGGGVCAYVRKDLKSSVLKELSSISERNFHQLWLNVQCKKLKSTIICVTYRPDDSPLCSFEEVLKPSCLLLLDKPITILGDLNCDGLKKTGTEYKALEKFCTDMNLKQFITKPTRITVTTQSLLNVILVSSNNSVLVSGIIHRPISDHSIVFVKLKVKKPKITPQYITTRSYKKYNADLFVTDLAKEADSLLTIFDQTDVESELNILNDTLQSVLSLHAPVKQIKLRSRPCPFVNQEIKDLMRSRDLLLKQFIQSRQDTEWINFKHSRDLVKKQLQEAERDHTFEEVTANKNNSGSLWKIINRAIPSKDKQRPAFTKNVAVLTNEFNQFFAKVGLNAADAGQRLRENIIVRDFSSENGIDTTSMELFNLRTVSLEEVRRIVTSLPMNKSLGPDKISACVLKDCLHVILGPLTDIINCSILTSTFPDNWKEAEVIPILKDGDHEKAANKRPLSLLAVASKLVMSFPLVELDAAIEKLEQDLHIVAQWCCENHLLVNPDKTKLLFLGTRQMLSRLPEDPEVVFLGKTLKPTDSAKDLGVFLDPHLTYDHHISCVISSRFAKLCQINRVKRSFDQETLELLITS